MAKLEQLKMKEHGAWAIEKVFSSEIVANVDESQEADDGCRGGAMEVHDGLDAMHFIFLRKVIGLCGGELGCGLFNDEAVNVVDLMLRLAGSGGVDANE